MPRHERLSVWRGVRAGSDVGGSGEGGRSGGRVDQGTGTGTLSGG